MITAAIAQRKGISIRGCMFLTANEKIASGAAPAEVPQGIPAPKPGQSATRKPTWNGDWQSAQIVGAGRSQRHPPAPRSPSVASPVPRRSLAVVPLQALQRYYGQATARLACGTRDGLVLGATNREALNLRRFKVLHASLSAVLACSLGDRHSSVERLLNAGFQPAVIVHLTRR